MWLFRDGVVDDVCPHYTCNLIEYEPDVIYTEETEA